MIKSTTHNREVKKYKNWKKENIELHFGKENTDVEEDTCVNLFRERNKDTPGNQIEYMDENVKICNSIFTFKEDAPQLLQES